MTLSYSSVTKVCHSIACYHLIKFYDSSSSSTQHIYDQQTSVDFLNEFSLFLIKIYSHLNERMHRLLHFIHKQLSPTLLANLCCCYVCQIVMCLTSVCTFCSMWSDFKRWQRNFFLHHTSHFIHFPHLSTTLKKNSSTTVTVMKKCDVLHRNAYVRKKTQPNQM